MGWFWWNVPLMVLFFGCWTGIPLWLTLTRWNAEVIAKHAEIAAADNPAGRDRDPRRPSRDRGPQPVEAN